MKRAMALVSGCVICLTVPAFAGTPPGKPGKPGPIVVGPGPIVVGPAKTPPPVFHSSAKTTDLTPYYFSQFGALKSVIVQAWSSYKAQGVPASPGNVGKRYTLSISCYAYKGSAFADMTGTISGTIKPGVNDLIGRVDGKTSLINDQEISPFVGSGVVTWDDDSCDPPTGNDASLFDFADSSIGGASEPPSGILAAAIMVYTYVPYASIMPTKLPSGADNPK